MLVDHIDLRVRDRAKATAFYDSFLSVLGAVKNDGGEFVTWRIPDQGSASNEDPDNFGITEDPSHVPGATRIAFRSPSRDAVDAVAEILRRNGARNVEMDDGIYGDQVRSVFFEDPDGNRLEVCFGPY
ncbi:MAG: VOC family protein [Candidatus Eremiobacteraeota bacterium]|nr:VOC family protein [Candidatus Eremiobacteraeota bacterium]